MKLILQSIVTAIAISTAVVSCSIFVVAPRLHCIVGHPVVDEVRTLKFAATKQFRLDNSDGAVQIRTSQPDVIVVSARVRVFASGRKSVESAREYADSLLKVTEADDGVRVETEPGDRPDAVNLMVDYSVQVPEGTDLAIENGNGNVSVMNGCGAVMVHGRNADIRIVRPTGVVSATSTNGQIHVEEAAADTVAETVNGSVYADTSVGSLRAKTTNGAIVARVLTGEVTECALSSQNGGITLVAGDGIRGRLNARTARGRIRFDIPVCVDVAKGCKNSRHVRGIFGDESGNSSGEDSTKLTLSAGNGNIWIARSN
ncbi:MAG: hypothetical protein HZB26_00075 [Candidatus Hydrogenedentes bacterium]|nr:hypothetical protein [Candidatus Hydrogenedentota bacterium]